jgi:CoA:oxalate CoA-transferase
MDLTARPQLLKGIRVLDLSRVMSGPYCTSMLADLGAEVIKIESPAGDEARGFGPHVTTEMGEESAYFLLLNRGKKSVTVDLKTVEGVALIGDLAERSDVLIENFRPGTADRLGVGEAAMRARNPKLIYASINGFGADSPLAAQPALDLAIQAMSGLMSMTGHPDGPPTAMGESIADVATGMFAAWGIAAALFERERSGQGRYLETAMMDSVFAMMLTGLSRWLYTGNAPSRIGNRHPESYPVDLFETRDGSIVLVVYNDQAFAKFSDAIGRPEITGDPRFATYAARHKNDAALREIVAAWAASCTSAEALDILKGLSIPCAPVWSLDEAAESDHTKSRKLVVDGLHANMGPVPLVPQPVRFDGEELTEAPVTPLLGEHTREVLGEILGMGDDAIDALAKKGAIGA